MVDRHLQLNCTFADLSVLRRGYEAGGPVCEYCFGPMEPCSSGPGECADNKGSDRVVRMSDAAIGPLADPARGGKCLPPR